MSVRLSVRPPKSGSVGPQPLAPRHPSLGRPSRPAGRPARPGGPPRTAPGRTSESVPLWRPLSLSRVLARRPMPTNHHPPPSRESASARPSPRAARWRCAPGRERRCTAGRLRRSARGRPLLIERGSLEWERVMIAWGDVMICAGGVRAGDVESRRGPPRTAPGRTSESVPLWRPLSLSRVLARRPMPTNHHPPPSRESASARPSPRAARWRCAPGRERRCTAGRLRRSARGRPLLIERGSLEWERVMIACGNVMICAGGVRPGDGASGGVWVGG